MSSSTCVPGWRCCARAWPRARDAADASDAGPELLAHQFATRQSLSPAERRHTVVFDGGDADLPRRLTALARRIDGGEVPDARRAG